MTKNNDSIVNELRDELRKEILGKEYPAIKKSPFWRFGWVSHFHLYEARERYYSLLGMTEQYAKLCGKGCPGEIDFGCKPEDIKCLKDYRDEKDCRKALITILECHKILVESKELLTRKQEDLNNLWRILTRVRNRIIEDLILPKMLPFQLYFCREESRRLGIDKEPDVQDMIQTLAEATNLKTSFTGEELTKFQCLLRALHERFLTIRTGRIHQQYVNIRTYKRAIIFLIPLTIILIAISGKFFTAGKITKSVTFQGIEWISWPVYLIETNILAFIFFGGLIGGFFSACTRFQDRNLTPGQDAYFAWYVLSKPLVGAVGAMLLFILLKGNLFQSELIPKAADLGKHGALAFGFAVICGFSERIIFPTMR